MPRAARREQILAKAGNYFAEYGLTAQTRGLADDCGISQRLLYSFFSSKSALLEQVYRNEIEGPFRAVWLAQLRDRGSPVADRLNLFYRDYYHAVLTRRWLRLFLYASLAEVAMAQTYITEVINDLLRVVVSEAALEGALAVPRSKAEVLEIGWVLHGAVSHLAIRRQIYNNTNPVLVDRAIEIQVRMFLSGLPSCLAARR